MDYNNFNDFIKLNTKEDLPVPAELDWENMNFTLPLAKRKRRILPLLFFFLIVVLGTGSGLWYGYQQYTQSKALSKNDNKRVQNQNNNSLVKEEHSFADVARFITIENLVSNKNGTNQKSFKTQQFDGIGIVYPKDNRENIVTRNNDDDTITFKTEQLTMLKMEENKPFSLSKTPKSNDSEYSKTDTLYQMKPSQLDTTEKTNQTSPKLQDSVALQKDSLIESTRSKSSENNLTISPDTIANSNTKHLTNSLTMLLNIGSNNAHMNHNSTTMDDAITPAWGNQYQILLEYAVKNNWLFGIGLGYQRLHTTFYTEKDLGISVKSTLSELQVIKKTRIVYHNNYFDFASLNIGAGKQYRTNSGLYAQLFMYLSPSYRLSYTGKFLDDSQSVVEFEPNKVEQKKWLLNIDAAFRVGYKLKNTDLILGVNLSQSLTKSDLLSVNNSKTTVQPLVLGVNIGVKRTLEIRKK